MKSTLTFQLIKTVSVVGVMCCLLALWPLTASEKTGHTVQNAPILSSRPGVTGETPSFPMTLTDAAGRDVTFRELPKRIVVIGRGPFMALHTLHMFPEAGEVIVGYEDRASTIKDFISLVNPVSANVIELGNNPGLEQIAALQPDLVIKKGYLLDKVGELVIQAGFPVFYVGLETPEQFFADVANFGRILGNPARADDIIRYYQTRMNVFSRRVANLAEADKPGILILHYDGRGSHAAMRVPPENWMQTIQVRYGGGRPVWVSETLSRSGWSVVNFEQIAAWNPDKIYIIFPFSAEPARVLSELKNNPLWKSLKAVQTGNLKAFPSDIIGWDTPEPRWLLGMTWMALNTHPDLFQDIDLNREIGSFFNTLYRIDPSVIDSEIRPSIKILGPDHP